MLNLLAHCNKLWQKSKTCPCHEAGSVAQYGMV